MEAGLLCKCMNFGLKFIRQLDMENSKEFNEGFIIARPHKDKETGHIIMTSSLSNPHKEGTKEFEDWKAGLFTAMERVDKCLQ